MVPIELLIMDVDGTLTDGKVYLGAQGEEMKAFHIKDGLGIVKLRQRGIVPVILTGRTASVVARRAAELGIGEVWQGVADKAAALEQLKQKYHCEKSQIAYIGDDENDLPVMALCGLVGCPADAAQRVRARADFVCSLNGGEGAVREFIEHILEGRPG